MNRLRSFLDERRERLAASEAAVNGIAGIDVDPVDKTRLRLRFVKDLPGPAGVPLAPLLPGDITITGGDRIRGISVLSVTPEDGALTLTVSEMGDFAPYTLTIDPDVLGFDPILRSIAFSFRIHCDTGADCATPPLEDAARFELRLDYLARDYESYRAMLLDRLAITAPDFTDRNPASLDVTLVEWLAALGEELSTKLDAVETEYSLETARLRPSAARHARLVGYRMHNGASARVLATIEASADADALDKSSMAFVTRSARLAGPVVDTTHVARAQREGALIFEPCHPIRLRVAHNRIGLHHWGDPDAMLKKGMTTAWLRDPGNALDLRSGDLLILAEEVSPHTGRAADADPAHRHAVRLTQDPVALVDPLEIVDGASLPVLQITWGAEDALPFDLCVGAVPEGEPELASAFGNVVVADHGWRLPVAEPLGTSPNMVDPELPPAEGESDEPKPLALLDRPRAFAPVLKRRDLTFSAGAPEEGVSATALRRVSPHKALPDITLNVEGALETWASVPDLLSAASDARAFVAEVSKTGKTRLRFGDGTYGQAPAGGQVFSASYRIGTGRMGNIGADALAHIATDGFADSVTGVRNPLPAMGGKDRETIDEVRQRAPVSFRTQRRAVTLADYETLLNAHPQVQRAYARKRWLGSWSAIYLSVDRVGGLPVDAPFRDALLAYLEPYRMMGHDLAIDAAQLVPLALVLHICVDREYFASSVETALRQTFSAGLDPAGQPAFFHPDVLSFGETLYLSKVYEAALSVPGVADVVVQRFSRQASTSTQALDDGLLVFGPREVPVLRNDPNFPGQGKLELEMEGGR